MGPSFRSKLPTIPILSRLQWPWPAAACLVFVLGVKLWLVGAYGSNTPFWDQWDAEAAFLYKPYLEGRLRIGDLFAAHNEHRIFFTRVLALLLLRLTGHWSPLLQMTVNTLIHIAAIGVLLLMLGWTLRFGEWLVFSVLSALFLAIPFGWENTLAGFQSQFYLLLLFSFASFLLFNGSAAFSSRWWAAAALAGASFLCTASGALTPISLAALSLAQICLRRRTGLREFLGAMLLALLGLGLLRLVPAIPGHAPLRAASMGQFLSALLEAAGWPFPWGPLGAVVLHLPVVILGLLMVRGRVESADWRWLYLGLWGWLGLQYLSLAYGRAVGVTAARYLDVFIVAVLVNFAALLLLLRELRYGGMHTILRAAAGGWIVVLVIAAGAGPWSKTLSGVAVRFETSVAQFLNLSSFLKTGDIAHLTGKPYLHVPYPSPQRLAQLASDPTIRSILPADLLTAQADLSSVARLKIELIRGGRLLALLGLGLFLAGAVLTLGQRTHERGAS